MIDNPLWQLDVVTVWAVDQWRRRESVDDVVKRINRICCRKWIVQKTRLIIELLIPDVTVIDVVLTRL